MTRMFPAISRALFFVLINSCGAGGRHTATSPDRQASARCDSVPDTLSPNQSLEGLAGRYHITVVETHGVTDAGGTFEGALNLWRTSGRDSSIATGRHAVRGDTLRNLYFGATNVSFSVYQDSFRRAHPPVLLNRAAVDPVFPPVLGFASRGTYEGHPWLEFTLAYGSIATRDGSISFDGAGVGLNVQRIDAAGLFGYWGAYGIIMTGGGYFCARRIRD